MAHAPQQVSSNSAVAGRPLWLKAVLFSAAYFLCALAGDHLSVRNSPYVSFWLPSGVFVGVLLLNEPRDWIWLVLAAFPANLAFDLLRGTPLPTIFLFYFSNAAQSVCGAWLVRRFVPERPFLGNIRRFAELLLYTGLLSTVLGSAIGTGALLQAGLATSIFRSFLIWWGSTGMAVAIVTPFMLAWFDRSPPQGESVSGANRMLEAALLIAVLVAANIDILVFGPGINAPFKSRLLPLLLWAGIRFGIRGATAANLILALCMGFLTTHFQRGLSAADLAAGDYVLTMQTFVAVAALVGMIPAIALYERDSTLADLRKSEEKYSKAFRSAPLGVIITEFETGRYIEVNESFCRMYGFSRDEITSSTALDLGMFEDQSQREMLLEPLRTHGCVRDLQLRTRARNGAIRIVMASAELIRLDGRQCILTILYDITSRIDAEVRLAQSRLQLKALLSRLQSLREEERTSIAREIHDHLGQLLTALKLDLRAIERRVAGTTDSETRVAINGKLNSAKQLVDETINSVQKIASELRPAILDRLGLEAAIEVEAKAFESRARLACDLDLPREPLGVSSDMGTAVFRIFQEVLTNIARHAHATRISVNLCRSGAALLLSVRDDGVGIRNEDLEDPKSLGLLGMQERAEILGGRITFEAGSYQGTTVTLEIPLAPPVPFPSQPGAELKTA